MSSNHSLDSAVLGRILMLQSALQAAPDEQRLTDMVAHGLSAIPGLRTCLLSLDSNAPPSQPASSESLRPLEIRTLQGVYGTLLLDVCDPLTLEPYLPFIANTANIIALYLENTRNALELKTLNRGLDTQIRERSRQLRETEERFALAMEANKDGLWDWNVVTGEVYYSPAYFAMLGFDPDELSAHVSTWSDLVHPDDKDATLKANIRCIEQPPDTFETEFRMRTRSGGWRWILGRGKAVSRDAFGRATRMVGTHTDITERKNAEIALRESESRYRALFESNPHPMWVYDLSTFAFLAVNDAAIAHYGFSREEFLSMTILDIRPPEEVPRLLEKISQVRTQALDSAGIYIHRKKDGSIIDVEITSHLLKYQGRRAEVVLAHDVTDHLKAEREKEKLRDQLLQAQKLESIGRLAGGVAHDFNNMLQAILGNAALALQQLPPDSTARECLDEIQKSALRSAELTRQLLGFARKQTIQPKVLDLNETVAGMLKMLRRLIGEDIHLVWKPGPNIWPVQIDPSQLDQILANLSINARDAMVGGGTLTIETTNTTLDAASLAGHPDCAPGDFVILLVGDTGRGMNPEIRAHLFEPFFTTKEPGKGTGLGLATVFGILQQNGGFINVASEPDHGTTFKLFLPRAHSQPPAAPAPSESKPLLGTETILLVEDEDQILNLGRRILEKKGYTVLTASNAEAALQIAANFPHTIHLLISDVVMPGLNGKELLRRLCDSRPHIKSLFMSGYTANVIAHHGILDEGIRLLQKPFTIQTLTEKVREVLEEPQT